MRQLIYFFFLVILFFNCENDLDINADWKEIPVIYSILNSGSVGESNTEHFIRVQKSFLGTNSAYEMAQIEDSIYYADDDLKLWVEKLLNNQVLDSINLDLVSNLDKDYGFFSTENHKVYKFNTLLEKYAKKETK